ncbi:MAG: ATP-binding cassette domain-containing protein [Desulfovibrionaceae bacterium]|nr:ATP-binding cassette domain-containing protein [Desulfovibrionaceae bacterium]
MPRPLVTASHVTVTLGGTVALRDISLTVRRGEHLALLGPNGAGKSTLLRLLRGEVRPDQKGGGSVFWFPAGTGGAGGADEDGAAGGTGGRDTRGESAGAPPRGEAARDENTREEAPWRGIDAGDDSPLTGRGMSALVSPALQERYIRQGWPIRGEDLILAGYWDDALLYREPTEEQHGEVLGMARRFRAENLLKQRADAMSQGQLRLALLMRALVRKPELLLLDEAADGLDTPTRRAFLMHLEALAELPAPPTLILSTHRPRLPGFIQRVISLHAGVLRGPRPLDADAPVTDDTEALEDSPPRPERPARFGTSGPNGKAGTPPDGPGAGHKNGDGRTGGPHIVLRRVTVFVDRVEVLHGVDWEIRPGEQWVLCGGNGAGKSTLLRLLLGDEFVAVGGELTRHLPRHGGANPDLAQIRRGIRLVSDRFQAEYSYNESTADIIFSGFDGAVGVYRDAKPAERAETARLLDALGLAELAERPFRSLSTGQARKALLGRALAGGPELLLLDEPFSGLDSSSRAAMIDILEERMAAGLHTVLVSHHAEDRLPSSTHIARLERGYMVECGPLARH